VSSRTGATLFCQPGATVSERVCGTTGQRGRDLPRASGAGWGLCLDTPMRCRAELRRRSHPGRSRGLHAARPRRSRGPQSGHQPSQSSCRRTSSPPASTPSTLTRPSNTSGKHPCSRWTKPAPPCATCQSTARPTPSPSPSTPGSPTGTGPARHPLSGRPLIGNRGHHGAVCVGPHGRSAAVGTTPYEAEVQHHRDCPFWAGVQHRGALPTSMRRRPHYRAGLIREAAACTVRVGSRCDISLQIVGKLGYPYRRLSERHVGLDRFTPDR